MKLCHACVALIFRFNINTTAFCLGRSSLHLLLLKSSMAWDSNPGPQDGRRRRNHGAMAATWLKYVMRQTLNQLPLVGIPKILRTTAQVYRSTGNSNLRFCEMMNQSLASRYDSSQQLPQRQQTNRATHLMAHHKVNKRRTSLDSSSQSKQMTDSKF